MKGYHGEGCFEGVLRLLSLRGAGRRRVVGVCVLSISILIDRSIARPPRQATASLYVSHTVELHTAHANAQTRSATTPGIAY
jgi:hypothetical protein